MLPRCLGCYQGSPRPLPEVRQARFPNRFTFIIASTMLLWAQAQSIWRWLCGCGFSRPTGSQIDRASPDSLKPIYSAIFSATLLLCACAVAHAQSQTQYTPIPTLQAPAAGYVFPQKETLSFDVDWRVFTAGT